MKANTFYIETYGCTSNKADSYIISDILTKSRYIQTGIENANFIIINTCAVKEQTENRIKTRLKKIYNLYHDDPKRYIIIAGCLPHISPKYLEVVKKIVPNFSAIIDLDNINKIPEIFQKLKQGYKNLVLKSEVSLDKSKYFIKIPPGKITGIIPISEGCLGDCTYCCVKNARGKLKCFDPEYIVENVKNQLKQGIKQIYLTSQDCSIYEYKGIRLVDLIQKIVKLDYKFFLRIGMINPSFLINNLEQLLAIFKLEKVYQFLHIPIQSGSNRILEKMHRPYLISEIIEKIDRLKKEFPKLTKSTDIICGFPGETEYDFFRTINFIKWLRPEITNISKFTPRPGTKAKFMQQIDCKVIKNRSIRLTKIFRNILTNINKNWRDWEGSVLVLHKGSEKKQAIGRNFAYKHILIDNFSGNYGNFVNVKIKKVEGFNLFGEIN